MAHELDMSNDRANMAFVGKTPWHGLGQVMTEDAPLEVWRVEAGMNWDIKEATVLFQRGRLEPGEYQVPPNPASDPNEACLSEFKDKKVLYRSDTGTPLSAVSASYNVVQPETVLEFYRDLIASAGFKMRTAGVLFGGKKFWALADIGKWGKVKDCEFGGYLLLATACDGSMATLAQFTSVEVVCNNTLRMAVQTKEGATRPRLSIPHSTKFDEVKVKAELGLATNSWDAYMEDVRQLANRSVSDREAVQWLIDTFGDPKLPAQDQAPGDAKIMKMIHSLFKTDGIGSQLAGREGTLLGLVSATTEYYDYHTGHRTTDGRLDKAWFGETAAKKQLAYDNAMLLAA